MNLDSLNVGRIILVLSGFPAVFHFPWSTFTSSVECEAMLVLLVLRPRYDLKEAQLFESVWSDGNICSYGVFTF
jgi:hypothetical protein